MDDCLFCKIIAGEIPAYKVYEDEDFLAFVDIKPVNLGHTLLLPKAHYRNLFDLPDDLLCKIGPLIQKLALAIKKATGADGINIGWNNESAAGQLIFHSHTHIMPRFKNDGHENWHGQNQTPEELETIKNKINEALI